MYLFQVTGYIYKYYYKLELMKFPINWHFQLAL